MWLLVLLLSSAWAQDETDISDIKKLRNALPDHESVRESDHDVIRQMQHRRHLPLRRKVRMEDIFASGTEKGVIREGRILIRLSDHQGMKLTAPLDVEFYREADEFGFKYLRNKDGNCTFMVSMEDIEQIREELVLYEPPRRYTLAHEIIAPAEWDRKLSLVPEATAMAGVVQGSYMRDLFNDTKANHGISTQYGIHLATNWKLPIKVGGVLHYESAIYQLRGNGQVQYHAWSFGPQFKTKDFEIAKLPFRLQTQFRVSPFARASAQTQRGDVDFKFNSADFLTSLEHPITNSWGSFVLAAYYQAQWLALKDQSEIVRVNASNAINASFGFSIAQVFQ